MIELEVELAVWCELKNGEFKVYLLKNQNKVEITHALSEWELKHLRRRADVKRELDQRP